jgi:hypothetical protein
MSVVSHVSAGPQRENAKAFPAVAAAASNQTEILKTRDIKVGITVRILR